MRSTRNFRSALIAGGFLACLFSGHPGFAQSGGTITGRVVSDDGNGLPDVTVSATAAGARGFSPRSATTDGEGNFRLTGLQPRSYRVYAYGSREYVQSQADWNRRFYRSGDKVAIEMIRGGVITGRVTNAAGEPVIGVNVSPVRIRDAEGKRDVTQDRWRTRYTDDRGAYRIFGLSPGVYIVEAGGKANYSYSASKYDADAPTFYPSSTRDAAAEVTVSAGGESSGIDIRYRGEPGRAISGRVTGTEGSMSNMLPNIHLVSVATGTELAFTYSNMNTGGFGLYGVPDGEYEIYAERSGEKGDGLRSTSKRVAVRGADVTGVELKLLPAASIAGKVVLEPAEKRCDSKRALTFEEIILLARRDDSDKAPRLPGETAYFPEAAPDEKGEFILQSLDATRYRVLSNWPDENWYLKSIAGPQATAAKGAKPAPGVDLSRDPISLKSGEKFDRVVVSVAEGAAGLRGQLVSQKGGATTTIHLIPAEATAANDVLRYAENVAAKDGVYEFKQITPGRYWLVSRTRSADESVERNPAPAAWDAAERASLRKEAASLKDEIELQPCQRVTDLPLKVSNK